MEKMEKMENVRRTKTKQPIEDTGLIKKLLALPGRDGLIMGVCLYTGLRNNEIISLKWQDVLDPRGNALEVVEIYLSKQSNLQGRLVTRHIKILPKLQEKFLEFYKLEGKPALSRYIFYAQKKKDLNEPLHKNGINYIVKQCAKEVGMKDWQKVSTHTMRKTLCLNYYKVNGLAKTMRMMNYSNPETVLSYLGITRKTIEDGFIDFYESPHADIISAIEEGEIQIEVENLIKGEKPANWGRIIAEELRYHVGDLEQVYEAVRWLLAPHRAKLSKK